MKKIALFLAAICCAIGLQATECPSGGSCGYDANNTMAWVYADGVLTIHGSGVMASYTAESPAPWDCWKAEVEAVVIENASFIGEYAFNGFTALTTVQLPANNQFNIGKYAFGGCTALSEIVIPAGVQYIRKNAFNGSGLTTVYLLGEEPFEFMNYGGYDVPFNGCASIAHIYVPAGSLAAYTAYWSNTTYGNEGYVQYMAEGAPAALPAEITVDGIKYAVDAEKKTLTVVANGYTAALNIPRKVISNGAVFTVTAIGANAFQNISAITVFDVPTTITSIGANAYDGCALTVVNVPEQVTSIGANAFANNSGLVEVKALSATPATIGTNAFGSNADLVILVPADYVNAYKTAWSAYADDIYANAPYAIDEEIGDFTYYLRGGNTLTAQITGVVGTPSEVTIPASVTYQGYTYTVNGIETNAFKTATSIEKLTLAANLNKEGMTEGVSVSIGFSFTKAQLDAMLAAGTITQAQYDQLYQAMLTSGQGTSVFATSNTTLKEVVIADGITKIPAALFGGLAGIEKVTIPASVTSIDEDAFVNCTGITSVTCEASSPADLSGLMRAFPMKTADRVLFYPYTARATYISKNWNFFFNFDEATDSEKNISSLETEQVTETAIQETLAAMKDEAENAGTGVTVTTNLKIQRTLYKDGHFNTICLPFALTAEQIAATDLAGCEIFKFVQGTVSDPTGAATLDMEVSKVTAMDECVPYLIRWANTGEVMTEVEFKDIQIANDPTGKEVVGANGNVSFKGHIGIKHVEKEDTEDSNYSNLYLIANDKFRWPVANDATNMKGFRAYFRVRLNEQSGNAPIRRGMGVRFVVVETNSATDVENVESNMQSVKVVENGQMFIIRNGVRYNMAGQIVR